jgi:hypothetical protein
MRGQMKTLNSALVKVVKRLPYPLEVILIYVRWYVIQIMHMVVKGQTKIEGGAKCPPPENCDEITTRLADAARCGRHN